MESIPERKFNFVRSETTNKYIQILNDMRPGTILMFRPTFSDFDKDRATRKVRDYLRVAVKHADGDFKMCRRNYSYYVEKLRARENEKD